jgi:hypothetical protein
MSAKNLRGIKSWSGLETFLDQIRGAAVLVRDTDAIVRATNESSVATGLICEAIRDPSKTTAIDVARAAQAQTKLHTLHGVLVQQYGMDFDFVRREWATILDPSPGERDLCEKLIL